MAEYYAKSTRGRQVLRDRHYPLARSARNLLLILDASRPVRHWLHMVRGAGWAEIGVLEQAGLIEPVEIEGPAETRPMALPSEFHTDFGADLPGETVSTRAPGWPAPPPPLFTRALAPVHRPAATPPVPRREIAPEPESISAFLPLATQPRLHSSLDFSDLYDSLTALARQTLGLLRGYRYTLRIEKARDIDELEQVASDFVAEVERVRGRAAARTVGRALGLEGWSET